MDPCWKDTPEHIIHKILHLACSKLIYRNNRYIEINKVECKNEDLINEIIQSKLENIENSKKKLCFYFLFKKPIDKIIQGRNYICNHGLSYNFNYWGRDDSDVDNHTYVITYYIDLPFQYKVTRMFIN